MSKLYQLSVSIVLFNTPEEEIESVLRTLRGSDLRIKTYLIDNSPEPLDPSPLKKFGEVIYVHTGKNLGYGSGHNIAINKAKKEAECHLVLNADVKFNAKILSTLYQYMMQYTEVGLLAPKIYNPDGTLQYSAKLLPNPINLIVRRFIPIQSFKDKLDFRYELKSFSFDRIIEVPYVMGCFMFINCRVFEKVEGFDERFFMYPEDIDLTRRIFLEYKALYYPEVSIVHEHGRGSYKSSRLLYYHVTSMIRYFNKWGWIFDKERRNINKRVLAQINQ